MKRAAGDGKPPCRVYLDGVIVVDVLEVDTRAGRVVVADRDYRGNCTLNGKGEIVSRVLTGKVRVETL